jgi:6-phosphofructokinase
LTARRLIRFQPHQIDALISVGGDGSMEIANALAQKGLWVVGVPKTIDNDLEQTVITFGFDTATAFATECLDRLHTTAASHRRVIVVEVMGRYAGWIALESGISGRQMSSYPKPTISMRQKQFILKKKPAVLHRCGSRGRNQRRW